MGSMQIEETKKQMVIEEEKKEPELYVTKTKK